MLLQILQNQVLIASILGWIFAQIVKLTIYAYLYHTIRLERLVGDGGMPSAHSATVTALAVATGIVYGFNSGLFAVAVMFAIIVMHDAMGVRQVTGNQSIVLNELMDFMKTEHPENYFTEKKLKEFVGHTPLQVVCGAAVGFIISLIYCLCFC